MLFKGSYIVLSVAALAEGLAFKKQQLRDLVPDRVVRRQADATCLAGNAVQTGSQNGGQDPPVDGQSVSATDDANFINFCAGETLTNGLQVQGGSCNGIVMGKIPSNNNMISAIIVNPSVADNLEANTDFDIQVQLTGLSAGSFTNAQKTYYSAPQDLDGQGRIIGHTHVSVQDLGNSLAPTTPPDPKTFVFFKGINDDGNGNGLLSATVTGGLPAGNYRVCSMTSASNHQPVIMPVAQRGPQDDCQKFTVGAANAGNNNAGNNNAGNANAGNNNAGNANAGNANAGNNNAGNANAGNANAGNNNAGNANAGNANAGNNNAGNANAGNNNAGNANAGNNAGNANAGGNNAAAVAGIAAPAVTNSGDAARPFAVNGNTFVNEAAAKQRACDIQNNQCSDAVNGGRGNGATIAQCQAQQATCLAAA
ncbi:hypothetical protein B0O99DRAFT_595033 [Bisporella sp. PMI_857]|nr:hypothetical protein B0O99DRAFT_595033 [Bisporella sp. PMI_857]